MIDPKRLKRAGVISAVELAKLAPRASTDAPFSPFFVGDHDTAQRFAKSDIFARERPARTAVNRSPHETRRRTRNAY